MDRVREFPEIDAAIQIPIHQRRCLYAVPGKAALIFSPGICWIQAAVTVRIRSGKIGLQSCFHFVSRNDSIVIAVIAQKQSGAPEAKAEGKPAGKAEEIAPS